jgi:hypothetical protein
MSSDSLGRRVVTLLCFQLRTDVLLLLSFVINCNFVTSFPLLINDSAHVSFRACPKLI